MPISAVCGSCRFKRQRKNLPQLGTYSTAILNRSRRGKLPRIIGLIADAGVSVDHRTWAGKCQVRICHISTYITSRDEAYADGGAWIAGGPNSEGIIGAGGAPHGSKFLRCGMRICPGPYSRLPRFSSATGSARMETRISVSGGKEYSREGMHIPCWVSMRSKGRYPDDTVGCARSPSRLIVPFPKNSVLITGGLLPR